ncbi:hypothetical protein BH23GEM10_BH23GEM10_04810 [soil metagenome]
MARRLWPALFLGVLSNCGSDDSPERHLDLYGEGNAIDIAESAQRELILVLLDGDGARLLSMLTSDFLLVDLRAPTPDTVTLLEALNGLSVHFGEAAGLHRSELIRLEPNPIIKTVINAETAVIVNWQCLDSECKANRAIISRR